MLEVDAILEEEPIFAVIAEFAGACGVAFVIFDVLCSVKRPNSSSKRSLEGGVAVEATEVDTGRETEVFEVTGGVEVIRVAPAAPPRVRGAGICVSNTHFFRSYLVLMKFSIFSQSRM